MKVELLREPLGHAAHFDVGGHVSRSLPFYRGRTGVYAHRVRSAYVAITKPEYEGRGKHTSISLRLWCGMFGNVRNAAATDGIWRQRANQGGELLAEPGQSPVCATCEGRALGAGFPSSVLIATHPIRFSPRLAS